MAGRTAHGDDPTPEIVTPDEQGMDAEERSVFVNADQLAIGAVRTVMELARSCRGAISLPDGA